MRRKVTGRRRGMGPNADARLAPNQFPPEPAVSCVQLLVKESRAGSITEKRGSGFIEPLIKHLDLVQLIKHAFGLRTEAQPKTKSPVFVYLYAEPDVLPDGRVISVSSLKLRARSIRIRPSSRRRRSDFPNFAPIQICSRLFCVRASADVRRHGREILETFIP